MDEKIKAFDYTRKRTKKEAALFYVASVVTGIILAVFVKAFAVLIFGEEVPRYFYTFILYAATFVYALFLVLRIMYCKNLWKNGKAIVLSGLSILLSPLLGLLLGLIPAGFLMMFKPCEKLNKD